MKQFDNELKFLSIFLFFFLKRQMKLKLNLPFIINIIKIESMRVLLAILIKLMKIVQIICRSYNYNFHNFRIFNRNF